MVKRVKVFISHSAKDFKLVDNLVKFSERSRWLPGLYAWAGYDQTTIPIEHAPRFSGNTKYNLFKKGKKEGLPLFKMPNQTVKTLYYDYIVRVSRETGLLDINIGKIGSLLHDMAYHGNWQAFFDYLTGKRKESTSLRDFIREEKVIQGFLLAYLGLSDYFVVHSEKELNGGYADIVMEPFLAGYEGIKYSYIIEIKYMKKADRKPGSGNREKEKEKVEQLKKEAELQLGRYSGDKRFERTIGKTKLIKLALVFCGSELRHIGPA